MTWVSLSDMLTFSDYADLREAWRRASWAAWKAAHAADLKPSKSGPTHVVCTQCGLHPPVSAQGALCTECRREAQRISKQRELAARRGG